MLRGNDTRAIAVILVVLSLLIGIVPQFTDCESQGRANELPNGKTIPKCHWTAIAELARAAPLLATSVMMLFAQRRETSLMLAVMGIILGAFTVLLPNLLVGVCASEMICNIVMQPLLTLCGILVIAASAAALVLTMRRQEPQHEIAPFSGTQHIGQRVSSISPPWTTRPVAACTT